ncbi:MAG TPA: hypothetical protein VGR66_11000 [Candidatus Eisenbacteria bacterium]|nr:hypothetical protein [Candidatus Eisenbacteria bacterium]
MRRPLFLAILLVALGAVRAGAQDAPSDSLDLYLHDLADSTDQYFGGPTATFDTTGLDSLYQVARVHPLKLSTGGGMSVYPVVRYHRAEGPVLGAGASLTHVGGGTAQVWGSYGFSGQSGRYAAGWQRMLFHSGKTRPESRYESGSIGNGTRLDFFARYARETLPIMPEHAAIDLGGASALVSGLNEQSVYEQRGVATGLTLWTTDFRFQAGFRHALDQPMRVETEFSFFGDKDDVPFNTAAKHDEYSEAFGGIAFSRPDWDFGGVLDARDGGGDRWRLRAALGKSLRVTRAFRASFQVEGGAAAAHAPRQRLFEIGGARAVPSLPYGDEFGDHLLLGKLELMYGKGILETLNIGHPRWLVLQPFGFWNSGAAWQDPAQRDIVFSKPPEDAFHHAAGFGLALRAGVPDPDTYFRFYLAFPLGQDSGGVLPRFTIRVPLDLLGKL